MKKYFLFFLLIFIFSCNVNKNKEVIDLPIIYSDEQIIKLGKVEKLSKFNKTIKIFNRGKADLKIISLKGSCSCTTTKISSKVIKPNKFALLSFGVDVPNIEGKSENTILIRNNSKDEFFVVKIYSTIY